VSDSDKLATTSGIEEIELLWKFPVDTHILEGNSGEVLWKFGQTKKLNNYVE